MLEGCVATFMFTHFEETEILSAPPRKVIRVSSPLRGDFRRLTMKPLLRDKLGITGKYRTLFTSCGGSMGAESINARKEVLVFMRDMGKTQRYIPPARFGRD